MGAGRMERGYITCVAALRELIFLIPSRQCLVPGKWVPGS